MKRTSKKLTIQPTTIRSLSIEATATVRGGSAAGICAYTGQMTGCSVFKTAG